MKKCHRVVLLWIAALLAGCGASAPLSPGDAGGTAIWSLVSADDAGATLEFDPATLPAGVAVNDVRIARSDADAAGYRVIVAYEFSPAGVVFSSPAKVSFPLASLDLGGARPEELRVALIEGAAATLIPEAALDAAAARLSAPLSHFSIYAVVVAASESGPSEERAEGGEAQAQNDDAEDPSGDDGDPAAPDADGDGVLDARDNCPHAANPDQADRDGDGRGDACDPEEEWGTTYYVRPGGGDASQCTGRADVDYSGSGRDQPCAWKHPFIALQPSGEDNKSLYPDTVRIAGGDRLIIGPGTYRMGLGAPGAGSCQPVYPWGCNLPVIPSGPDAAHPTRIVGAGWDDGCPSPPKLVGVERSAHVINLAGASNVRIACLEITDGEDCIEFHGGDRPCKRDAPPFGDWAQRGIFAADSANVVLSDLDIHGMADTGIQAGRLANWTLEDVRIANNGWVGWDGDIIGTDSNSGTMLFRRVRIEWNGCSEDVRGNPTGCWGQQRGGYGDGLGTGATGGDWIFVDSRFLHNTSDGLDMLYHVGGGFIVVDRVVAEGNAGNQIKLRGDAVVRNAAVSGNCAFFDGKPYSILQPGDHCRAYGNAVSWSADGEAGLAVVNSTIRGEGDGLLLVSSCGDPSGEKRVVVRNTIFRAETDYYQPWETSCFFYEEGCGAVTLDHDSGVIFNDKNHVCPVGAGDLCGDPLLGVFGADGGLVPGPGSPAIDHGLSVGARVSLNPQVPAEYDVVPEVDVLGNARPAGAGVDIGAYER